MGDFEKVTIGDATIYLGDCFEIMESMAGSEYDAIITDPPYGCTRNDWDVKINLELFWRRVMACGKESAAYCVFGQFPFVVDLVASNRKNFRYDWIFKKTVNTAFLDAKKKPLRGHEQILIFYRKKAIYNPQMRAGEPYRKKGSRCTPNYSKFIETEVASDGKRYPTTIIDVSADADFHKKPDYKTHPPQKPVPVLAYLAKTYSNEGGTIFDPFMGCGSTGVAAINTGRKFVGIELKREYFKTGAYRLKKAREGMGLVNIINSELSIKAEQKELLA